MQDGQDKDACADSFKLVCCDRKIEVNALQKPFCYFLGGSRNILQVCCDSQEFSLSPFPPYPAKSTPKISLCGTKFWPRYCSCSVHPELLISSTWTPGLGLSVLSCPQTSCKNFLCGSLRSQSSVFTAAVFRDSTDAFLHPWPPSLLLTFLIASRHQLGSPLILFWLGSVLWLCRTGG